MTNLSQDQKRVLKAKAHHLEPVVIIGQKGLTDNVLAEIDLALYDHELIKIKAGQIDKEDCEAVALQITDTLKAEFIATIGKILILYRKSNKKK
jgi:RNA-binding protein